jgi:hypothetical protein
MDLTELVLLACLRGKTCTIYELFIQAGQINYYVMNYNNSLFEWFTDSVRGLIILWCVFKERHVKQGMVSLSGRMVDIILVNSLIQIMRTAEVVHMQFEYFREGFAWGLHPSSMQCCITGWWVHHVWRQHCSLIFKGWDVKLVSNISRQHGSLIFNSLNVHSVIFTTLPCCV